MLQSRRIPGTASASLCISVLAQDFLNFSLWQLKGARERWSKGDQDTWVCQEVSVQGEAHHWITSSLTPPVWEVRGNPDRPKDPNGDKWSSDALCRASEIQKGRSSHKMEGKWGAFSNTIEAGEISSAHSFTATPSQRIFPAAGIICSQRASLIQTMLTGWPSWVSVNSHWHITSSNLNLKQTLTTKKTTKFCTNLWQMHFFLEGKFSNFFLLPILSY